MDEHGCSESQVYIWWDFLSVSQTDHAMQKRQIECLPIFVAFTGEANREVALSACAPALGRDAREKEAEL